MGKEFKIIKNQNITRKMIDIKKNDFFLILKQCKWKITAVSMNFKIHKTKLKCFPNTARTTTRMIKRTKFSVDNNIPLVI